MPDSAVTGDDMRFRPKMKRTAAASPLSPAMCCTNISLPPVAAGLEHGEHSVCHDIAAGGIGRAERDGDEAEDLSEQTGCVNKGMQGTDDDDAVDEVLIRTSAACAESRERG